MASGILWIASYPKSGNTWMRIFLANFIANAGSPVNINDLPSLAAKDMAGALFAVVSGQPFGRLSGREINFLRPAVHRYITTSSKGIVPVKTHIICGTIDGIPTITPEYTWKAVYVVRNPLDVAVSMAFHFGFSVSQAADLLVSETAQMPATATTIPQPIGAWDEHVESWTSQPSSIVETVRYEDLLSDAWNTFGRIRDFLGYPQDNERLRRSIEFSSFEALASAEAESGFVERPASSERFFRKGVTGDWKEHLTDADIEKIVKRCGKTMARFGYLDPDKVINGDTVL